MGSTPRRSGNDGFCFLSLDRKREATAKPPSEREGDREAVEGACGRREFEYLRHLRTDCREDPFPTPRYSVPLLHAGLPSSRQAVTPPSRGRLNCNLPLPTKRRDDLPVSPLRSIFPTAYRVTIHFASLRYASPQKSCDFQPPSEREGDREAVEGACESGDFEYPRHLRTDLRQEYFPAIRKLPKACLCLRELSYVN